MTAANQPSRRAPTPPRPLGREGRALWRRIWAERRPWISPKDDLDHVTILCESVDERVALRVQVLRGGEWRDRVALRALDAQIDQLMSKLGLNPTDREALGVGKGAKKGGKLQEMRDAAGDP